MPPITWRNVAAPSLNSSSEALVRSSDLLHKGVNTINNVLATQQKVDNANWENDKVRNTQAIMDQIRSMDLATAEAAQQNGWLGSQIGNMGAQVDREALFSALQNRDNVLRQEYTEKANHDELLRKERVKDRLTAFQSDVLSGKVDAAKTTLNELSADPDFAPELANMQKFMLDNGLASKQYLSNENTLNSTILNQEIAAATKTLDEQITKAIANGNDEAFTALIKQAEKDPLASQRIGEWTMRRNQHINDRANADYAGDSTRNDHETLLENIAEKKAEEQFTLFTRSIQDAAEKASRTNDTIANNYARENQEKITQAGYKYAGNGVFLPMNKSELKAAGLIKPGMTEEDINGLVDSSALATFEQEIQNSNGWQTPISEEDFINASRQYMSTHPNMGVVRNDTMLEHRLLTQSKSMFDTIRRDTELTETQKSEISGKVASAKKVVTDEFDRKASRLQTVRASTINLMTPDTMLEYVQSLGSEEHNAFLQWGEGGKDLAGTLRDIVTNGVEYNGKRLQVPVAIIDKAVKAELKTGWFTQNRQLDSTKLKEKIGELAEQYAKNPDSILTQDEIEYMELVEERDAALKQIDLEAEATIHYRKLQNKASNLGAYIPIR